MKKENIKYLRISVCMICAFVLWTVLIRFADVQPVGPQNSSVGLASVNVWIHNMTGVHMWLYTVTDWLGLVPVCFIFGFGILGLCQWIKRKSIRNVDHDILILGGFYIIVTAAFLFFESFVINYRPVLIDGALEASYPSSTTLLVMCVMPTASMQIGKRIKNRILGRCAVYTIIAFIAFMVAGRSFSGVHWFSDIIGGLLLSGGLVMMYKYTCVALK